MLNNDTHTHTLIGQPLSAADANNISAHLAVSWYAPTHTHTRERRDARQNVLRVEVLGRVRAARYGLQAHEPEDRVTCQQAVRVDRLPATVVRRVVGEEHLQLRLQHGHISRRPTPHQVHGELAASSERAAAAPAAVPAAAFRRGPRVEREGRRQRDSVAVRERGGGGAGAARARRRQEHADVQVRAVGGARRVVDLLVEARDVRADDARRHVVRVAKADY